MSRLDTGRKNIMISYWDTSLVTVKAISVFNNYKSLLLFYLTNIQTNGIFTMYYNN